MTASGDFTYGHAFVTGASSGIGRALAIELATKCKKISIHGRNIEELSKTKKLLLEAMPSLAIQIFAADLTSESERTSFIQKMKEAEIDLLVLNAGGGVFNLITDSNWEIEKKVLALNVEAPTHIAVELIPSLLQRAKTKNKKSGIIIVSSHAAFIRTPHFAVYGACKSYLNYFGLTLRQEMPTNLLDVLVVCPGATKTQFSSRAGLPQKMISTPMTPESVARQSLKQLGKKTLYIVAPFDRIIYLASRLLPIFIFDAVVGRLQAKLLKST